MSENLRAMYVTDDRDLPDDEQRALVIFQGGNGDWYVQVAPKQGRTVEGVRICTSGGASTQCPGLGPAIAEAYRAMLAAQNGERRQCLMPRSDLEQELDAWRARFPTHRFDGFLDIVEIEF
jgi:hypothetical protein